MELDPSIVESIKKKIRSGNYPDIRPIPDVPKNPESKIPVGVCKDGNRYRIRETRGLRRSFGSTKTLEEAKRACRLYNGKIETGDYQPEHNVFNETPVEKMDPLLKSILEIAEAIANQRLERILQKLRDQYNLE